jgi:hypothetical protein
MAIFGSVGKALGLGSARDIVTQVTGSTVAGNLAGSISSGVSRVGRTLAGTEQGQSTAVSIAPPPAETAFSGESSQLMNLVSAVAPAYARGFQQASLAMQVPTAGGRGNLQQANVPAIVQGGRMIGQGIGNLLGSGAAGMATAPIVIDQFGNERKLRVTRRLRSQVKRAVEMFGVEVVAEQMGVDVEVIFYILTKKMRNDGPYVTKAAVRKTRQTVRKMKHLCDMYDDLRPPVRRRAPARKSSSVTQIKN